MKLAKAVRELDKAGVLLVFPIKNSKQPPSLWGRLYPKEEMRWEWDEEGDDRVSRLWRMREELSRSGQAVYTKWYRGRGTLFSPPLFRAMVRVLAFEEEGDSSLPRPRSALSRQGDEILGVLKIDSPMSTKALKSAVGLRGAANEAEYNRALKTLWEQLQIVVFGEVDEGAFPSIAIGATSVIFESLFREAQKLSVSEAEIFIKQALGDASLFYRYYLKLKQVTPASPKHRRQIPSVIEGSKFR